MVNVLAIPLTHPARLRQLRPGGVPGGPTLLLIRLGVVVVVLTSVISEHAVILGNYGQSERSITDTL